MNALKAETRQIYLKQTVLIISYDLSDIALIIISF